MEKPAKNRYPINELTRHRWSPRAYSDAPVEREKLQSLFEAARWAPSSGNEQPWRFIVGIKPGPEWDQVFRCLDPGNQRWCHNIPVLAIICGKSTYTKNGKPNHTFLYETGQAAAHASAEAVRLGLYFHQMSGFYPDLARTVFAIPDDYIPIAAMAVGYSGDPVTLPEDLRLREYEERTRRDYDELVFTGRFGQSTGIFQK